MSFPEGQIPYNVPDYPRLWVEIPDQNEIDKEWSEDFRRDHSGRHTIIRVSFCLLEYEPRKFHGVDLDNRTGEAGILVEGDIVGIIKVPGGIIQKNERGFFEYDLDVGLELEPYLRLQAVQNTGPALTWLREQQVWIPLNGHESLPIYD